MEPTPYHSEVSLGLSLCLKCQHSVGRRTLSCRSVGSGEASPRPNRGSVPVLPQRPFSTIIPKTVSVPVPSCPSKVRPIKFIKSRDPVSRTGDCRPWTGTLLFPPADEFFPWLSKDRSWSFDSVLVCFVGWLFSVFLLLFLGYNTSIINTKHSSDKYKVCLLPVSLER